MGPNLTELAVHVHRREGDAVLVSTDGVRGHATWLPLPGVKVEMTEKNLATVKLPEHLAISKGLI